MKLYDIDPPAGVFPGVNFMTPNVVGYFKLHEGYAEVAKGRGLDGELIVGVTVRRQDGEHFQPERSKMVYRMADALAYVAELTERKEPVKP